MHPQSAYIQGREELITLKEREGESNMIQNPRTYQKIAICEKENYIQEVTIMCRVIVLHFSKCLIQ